MNAYINIAKVWTLTLITGGIVIATISMKDEADQRGMKFTDVFGEKMNKVLDWNKKIY